MSMLAAPPTRAEVEQLASIQGQPTVSLYLPTHQAGPDTRENPIRYKNLLNEAEAQLGRAGWEQTDVDALLTSARELNDYRFWQNQRQGLAVFVSGGERFVYRLPYAPPELSVVATRVHLKPLLPLLTGDGHFFIISMSLNQARLFEATRHSVSEVPLEDMPTSLGEALKYDDFEPHAEHFTVSAPNRGDAALVQGQGGGEDARKTNILRYFQAFDNGLRELLEPQGDRIPVVFAGDKGIFPIYREANHYKGLLETGVEGNPEGLSPEELHARAWEVVEPHFEAAREAQREAFAQAAGADTGRAGSELEEVLLAALDGRVQTLFIPLSEQVWGEFDSEARTLTLKEEGPESYDLYDAAAATTLQYGGTVYAAEPEDVPGEGAVAAIYRF